MSKSKVFFAVLLCKLLRFFAGLLGRGSSLPGKIVLKLFPGILGAITLPDKIIAVTGSNGKTSTVEMIAHMLKSCGKKVAYNKEGSNQIEGITTFLLCDCNSKGVVKSDIVLIESDERFARHTFKYFKPNYFIITNLYRDQLTRNGHPEWVYNVIKEAIDDSMTLVLNADDPLVSMFGAGREGTLYFGADKLPSDTNINDSVYNDGKYCPICKAPMTYDYYHYNHIGAFNCPQCGYKKQPTRWTITDASLQDGYIVVNGKYRIDLAFKGIYHCYNNLAALAAAEIAGVPMEDAVKALSNYALHSGRILEYKLNGKPGMLLTSKHENSVSYDRSIDVALADKRKIAVMVIVDAVSRKYFTGETSWLWDIDFEKLNAPNISKIILAGRYYNDLACRFEFTGIPSKKIIALESIPEATNLLKNTKADYTYVITCFSDKGKFTTLTDKGVK